MVPDGFYMATHEITQGQWRAVMGTSPWLGQENVLYLDNHPAVNVSWNSALALVERLNRNSTGHHYRLPTDTEWEYAARAGTTTTWFFGDNEAQLDEHAWYYRTTIVEEYAHAVATRTPNPWGLYDVYGNVWEWVHDEFGNPMNAYDADSGGISLAQTDSPIQWSILRGGGWLTGPESAQSAGRVGLVEQDQGCYIGIRLVMDAPEQ